MNEIIIRLKIIFLLGAVILSYQAVAQKVSKVHLKFVKVEAPFPMDSVRMCIFPDQDFPITQYGAKKEVYCLIHGLLPKLSKLVIGQVGEGL